MNIASLILMGGSLVAASLGQELGAIWLALVAIWAIKFKSGG